MKALSIKQPWASLIVAGLKPVENRTQPRKYRGPLLIHASKKFDDSFPVSILTHASWLSDPMKKIPRIIKRSYDLRGGILGRVNMVDCVTEHDSMWFSGPYGWVFKDPKAIRFIEYKGALSFFDVPLCPNCFQNYEKYGPCPCIDPYESEQK